LSKARGEEALESLGAVGAEWQIVRTSWLFGNGSVNFVKTIRRLLSERETVRVVADQRGCPTYSVDLAELLCCLIRRRAIGKFHGTNRGVCSWFEFAREIAVYSGADPERIQPCTTADYPTPARRPANSVLRSERAVAAGCALLPAWQDALQRYITRLAEGTTSSGSSGTT
jgi:dTDP-4-dehydrorhamnose reductase